MEETKTRTQDFPGDSVVKNPPEKKEMRFWSLGGEDPLEEGTQSTPVMLGWRIPWAEDPGGLQSTGSQRVGHDWVTFTFIIITIIVFMVKNPPAMWDTWVWSLDQEDPLVREWLLTPVFLPGEFHGQRLQSTGSQRVGHNWVTFTFICHVKSEHEKSIMAISKCTHTYTHTSLWVKWT